MTKLTDATFREMKRALTAFKVACNNGGEVSLFYFAGHGVEIGGVNYLIGKDTGEDEIDIQSGALCLDHVIQHMEPQNGDTRTTIIILDACRERPFSRKWRGKPHALASVNAPRGTLIAFATSPGQYAADGVGRNGAYTEALLKHIEELDIPIEVMFKNVRNTLAAATRNKQISWEHTSLAGDFSFMLSVAARVTEYGPTAIADNAFILDEGRFSHRTIKALKSISWYTQNPALENATVDKLDKAGTDSLFVLGRNILQAAHGHAHAAEDWIARFPQLTLRMQPAKRKALLDGILFEIFFDPTATSASTPRPTASTRSSIFKGTPSSKTASTSSPPRSPTKPVRSSPSLAKAGSSPSTSASVTTISSKGFSLAASTSSAKTTTRSTAPRNSGRSGPSASKTS